MLHLGQKNLSGLWLPYWCNDNTSFFLIWLSRGCKRENTRKALSTLVAGKQLRTLTSSIELLLRTSDISPGPPSGASGLGGTE